MISKKFTWQLDLHITLSMLAYSLLSVATLFAVSLWIHIKKLKNSTLLTNSNPISIIDEEKKLFQIVFLGWLTLTASLISGVVFINDFVFDEVEAGEYIELEQTKNMSESYTREKGDLNTQVQIVGVELRYLENEHETRGLTVSEINRMKALLSKESVLIARIKMINCMQDMNRDPATC